MRTSTALTISTIPNKAKENSMFETAKARVKKVKQVVQENKTAVACSIAIPITAAVTYKLTHKQVIAEISALLYQKGYDYGAVQQVLIETSDLASVLTAFVREKGLNDEFAQFAPQYTWVDNP